VDEWEECINNPESVDPDIAFDRKPSEPGTPMIEFRGVGISFDERKVLENVSFTVQHGETLCILGRSGVGKSVALRMLMGFLKPDEGTIFVDGQEITGLDEEGMQAIRRRVTMVFQLRENENLSEEEIQSVVEKLVKLVGAENVVDALPASLSTGRRRAVAIARALAARPEVVLYDEPTTMVDPIIARRMGVLIQRLKEQRGLTSIVVTHDMRFAEELADKVLFLHQGEALFYGSLKKFMASPLQPIQQFLQLDAYKIPAL